MRIFDSPSRRRSFARVHPGRPALVPALAVALVGLAACDSDGTGPVGTVALSLSVATALPAGAGAASTLHTPIIAAGDLVFDDGQSTLVLSRVALVLREVELERASDDDCADGPGDDDCEEFSAGPFILELPMDGGVRTVVSIDVPPDTYDELEFEIHKPQDDTEDDLAFIASNPQFDGVSIRVEGTYDGRPFVFEQDLDAEQEVDLFPPLVIEEGGAPANLTLTLDVATWFRTAGGDLIDPALANEGGPFEDVVEGNIEASFEVFEDDDEDGERD